MMKRFAPLALLASSFPAVASAQTIFVLPGQCINVGAQQVCGQAAPGTAIQPAKSDVMYLCRFGKYEGSETPEMKSWALFQVRVNDNGTKVETLVKNFGMNAQEACEKAAQAEKAKG